MSKPPRGEEAARTRVPSWAVVKADLIILFFSASVPLQAEQSSEAAGRAGHLHGVRGRVSLLHTRARRPSPTGQIYYILTHVSTRAKSSA